MDAWIVKESCLDRLYEKYGAIIRDNWTVIDIGAGLGDFAVLIAHEHPTNKIFAFEPFVESFELLNENIALNGVTNIISFCVAVGAKTGLTKLAIKEHAVQHTTADSTFAGKLSTTLDVPVLSLDYIFYTYGLQRCEFMKIDCEGGEFEILLSASAETLSKISHLCLEYHDGFTRHSHEDLKQHLEECGFAVNINRNPVHNHLGFLYAYQVGASSLV
jgi:FkbM family methyltransferase